MNDLLTPEVIDVYDLALRVHQNLQSQSKTNMDLTSNGLKVANCLHSHMERQEAKNAHFRDLYHLLREETESLRSIGYWLIASALGTCACLIIHLVWGH